MILDATAGNRRMWMWRDSENIIYIDRQLKLEMPPTIFCDNEQTPFKDELFDTIFYDPPHSWGDKGGFYSYPRHTEEYMKKYKDKDITTYYGIEQYDRREQLVRHVYNAQKELERIAKEDGLLWLKWNETAIPLDNILTVMTNWQCLMKIPVTMLVQKHGSEQTYWLCMQKKRGKYVQESFDGIPAGYDSSVTRFNPTKPD